MGHLLWREHCLFHLIPQLQQPISRDHCNAGSCSDSRNFAVEDCSFQSAWCL